MPLLLILETDSFVRLTLKCLLQFCIDFHSRVVLERTKYLINSNFKIKYVGTNKKKRQPIEMTTTIRSPLIRISNAAKSTICKCSY